MLFAQWLSTSCHSGSSLKLPSALRRLSCHLIWSSLTPSLSICHSVLFVSQHFLSSNSFLSICFLMVWLPAISMETCNLNLAPHHIWQNILLLAGVWSGQSFSTLALLLFGATDFFVVGSCPGYCGISDNIFGLHPLDSPSCDKQKCLQTWPHGHWRRKSPAVEEHWFKLLATLSLLWYSGDNIVWK